MRNGDEARNGVERPAEDLLPGQHPWSRDAGERLAKFRDERGWPQPKLAEVAGLSRGTISNLERGKHRPEPGSLEAIAKALDMPMSALLPAETKEATAFHEGVAYAMREVGKAGRATLSDLRRRLGLSEGGTGQTPAAKAARASHPGAKKRAEGDGE